MSDETVIIGGGPAGAAAAIKLSRQGMPVRLLERKPGPHHKVCGEFISYEAAQNLKELGLDLAALGAEPIRNVRIYNGENELTFDLPFTAWSLSRRLLDSALIEQAGCAGANVALGTAVKQLSRTHEGWKLVARSQSSAGQTSTELSAQTVFLASGKHELRNWKRNVKASNRYGLIGLKMHFRPSTLQQAQWKNTVEIHLFNGGYAGLEPIEKGDVNLCFLISQDIYKACGGNWLRVLNWLGRTSSHMKQRLATLTPRWCDPLAVSGIPYGYIHSPNDSVPNLFSLGDQAAVIPSFAGDGIAIALHTASLAAYVHTTGGDSRTYQQLAFNDLTQPVRNAEVLASMLSNRLGRTAAFACARLWPTLPREMVLRTRVGLSHCMQ
ncbi:NAD(P)/FAD-dependent oxidoreductase [Vreelandella nanhaiensis]|uniref:Protein CbrA n=1 Tax=Vreelandella nanhaiensis TaxID=1258546 RepID=A0A433KSQ1_9GAMM|nr:FAD-dependent monooxygenase [Halomonas nanhaiensis]RUR32551.1 NAD(P)/FAD-dependent oxidoreductase [Halomonas nanhaiensis]